MSIELKRPEGLNPQELEYKIRGYESGIKEIEKQISDLRQQKQGLEDKIQIAMDQLVFIRNPHNHKE